MDIGTLTGAIELEDQLSEELKTLTHHVKGFADEFDGLVGKVLVGSLAMAGAIAGIAGSIILLGEEGSVINGVEESFDQLAQTVGSTGEAMVGALTEGTKGTIDSLKLMESTTKLLSSGMKITEGDMKTIAATAREMGKATGQDASVGLNVLSNALLTGNLRSLKRFGINVDLVESEKKFAASLGTTRDELSQTGKLEAARIGILEAAKVKLDLFGESQLSFKERVQQSSVVIGGWFDNLKKGIDHSPEVSRAFDTISKSIAETFGPASQDLLKTLLGWVDKFSDAVTKFGPTIIQILGGVKDWVVKTWGELVSFNDRWQITNNLIAGAKFAWSVLETAFRLVEKAVQSVIKAWSLMPDWLQRITVSSLQAAAAVSAFGLGVSAVAAPFAALISKLDLGLNIFSNLSVSIHSMVGLWPKLILQYELATSSIVKYTTALRMSTIGSNIEIVVTQSVALAKITLAAATSIATTALTALSARLGITTAALYLQSTATKVVEIAQATWAIAVAFVSTSYTGLIARLGLTSAAMRLSTIATYLTAGAMEVLGFAILSIQAIPLIALLTALGFALYEAAGSLKSLYKTWSESKTMWEFFTADSQWDKDNWLRRLINDITEFLGLGDVFETTANKIDTAAKKLHKGGTFGTPSEFAPTISPGATAGGSSEFQKAAAERALKEAHDAGRGLTEVGEGFLKASTVAEDFTKKVHDLGKAWAVTTAGFTDNAAFSKAFESLGPKQLANPDLQASLVPGIDKLIADHKTLSKGMAETRANVQATTLAFLEQDKKILEGSDLTLTSIDLMKKLGLTEKDIAGNYGVSTQALQMRITAMQEAAQLEQNVATFESALLTQREKDIARRQALELGGSKAIGQAQEDLDDLIRQSTASTTEIKIRAIHKEEAERTSAFKGSEDQVKDFDQLQSEIAKHRINEAIGVNTYLKEHSAKTAQDEVRFWQAALDDMLKNQQSYTLAEKREVAERLKASIQAADTTRTVWDDVWDSLKDTLASIPDLISEAFTGGGGVSGALKALGTKISKSIIEPLMKDFQLFATKAQKVAMSISTGAASLIGGAVGGGAGSTIGGIASTMGLLAAQSGVFGTAIAGSALAAGALSLGIGAAAVGAYVLIKHFTSTSKEVKETRAAVADFESKLHDTLTEAQKIEAGGVAWKQTVIAVRDAYILVGKSASDAESAVTAMWDTGHPARARAAADVIAINVALAQNVRGVRSMVQEYLGAGTAIPPALQAGIDKLVIMGKLTTDNATAMLDLVKTSVPSYADVTAAAERYGIVVDTLGAGVQSLRLTEIADQMVTDFKTMEDAGADMNVVMGGMRDEVLSLISDSLKFGTALPAALKPIIDRMNTAGEFTDEFGNSLVDLTKLTFAETLTDKVQKLVDAMLMLVDVISNQVNPAFDAMGRKSIPNPSGSSGGFQEPYNPDTTQGPTYYASGGTVGSNVIPWRPRGSDTVPAMLTPGETVTPAGESMSGEVIIINEIDGKMLAKSVFPYIPGQAKRFRLRSA